MKPDELKEEIEKCRNDATYFIKNYVYITHPVRGRVKFDLYRFQERIVNEFGNHRFNLMRKFRQAGATTICAAYALWYIIFNKDKNVIASRS